MVSEWDENLLGDPAVALIAMELRLIKTDYGIPQDHPLIQTLEEEYYSLGHHFWTAVRAAQCGTGSSQTFFEEFDRVRSEIVELDRARSLSHPEWTESDHGHPRVLIPTPCSYWTEGLFALTVRYDLSIYVHQQIKANGYEIIRKARERPLLCNILDELARSARKTCGMLLNGADPNESFKTGTVWSFIAMMRSNSYVDSAISIDDKKTSNSCFSMVQIQSSVSYPIHTATSGTEGLISFTLRLFM